MANTTPIELIALEKYNIFKQLNQITTKINNKNFKLDHLVKVNKLIHPATINKSYLQQTVSIGSIGPIEPDIKIFTDGSKSENGVGAGIIIYSNNISTIKKFKLHHLTTIFQAELFAILQSLNIILDNDTRNQFIILYTDSLSSIYLLKQFTTRNKLANQIHEAINNIQINNNKIELQWVKAHAGIEGNEEADKAAKDAVTSKTKSVYNRIPISHVKSENSKQTIITWENIYANAQTKLKEFFPTVDDYRTFRKDTIISTPLINIFTGHGPFNEYLFRFKIKDSAECSCGHECQSTNHLIYDCPRIHHIRYQLILATHISTNSIWPVPKTVLTSECMKRQFIIFLNKMWNILNEENSTKTS